jgi:chromosomal replication initiator protein
MRSSELSATIPLKGNAVKELPWETSARKLCVPLLARLRESSALCKWESRTRSHGFYGDSEAVAHRVSPAIEKLFMAFPEGTVTSNVRMSDSRCTILVTQSSGGTWKTFGKRTLANSNARKVRFPMFEELLISSQTALRGVDTYLSLSENRLARSGVTRLDASRSTKLSGAITVVSGAAGIGKTHLAKSTLAEISTRHADLRFVYTSVQNLCELMQRADEQQMLAEFLENCRMLDVLVCEDLHWLEQAPIQLRWFLMLVESLEEELTQILMTSRKPVGELRSLEQRLVSRCHGGLCVTLPMLSVESRVKLLQHWFQELRLPILKPFAASAQFLAERLPIPPRELRQSVVDLADLQLRQPSLIDVKYLEKWLSKGHQTPRLSFETILIRVANEFGVDPVEIRSRSRQQGLAVPRQCAMWLARDLTGRPLEQIGAYFDRSHTTVSHSLSKLNELLPKVPSLRQQVQKLRQQLKELPLEDCA